MIAGQPRELFACSGCKKRFYADGFEVDRLGRRRKCCLECKAKRVQKYCEHGRQRNTCRECGGSSICEHGRQRNTCRECGGASICEHGRQRAKCRDCGGSAFCEHDRERNRCRECGGSAFCEHDRERRMCRECGGSSICEHGRWRNICRDCGGASICEHGRQRRTCRECDPGSYLRSIVTSRIRSALGSDKERGSLEYLGCSVATLRWHIEQQFEPGMTWDNQGNGPNTWQIDHIVPIKYPGAAGGDPTLEEVAERLHWTNCQPMWSADNIAKGNRFIGRERAPEAPKNAPAVPLTNADVDELLGDLL